MRFIMSALNMNNINSFLSSYASDVTLPDGKEKALKGAENVVKELNSLDFQFKDYFEDSLSITSDRWMIDEFFICLNIIKDLGNAMKDYATPYKLPINMQDPVIKNRVLAGK